MRMLMAVVCAGALSAQVPVTWTPLGPSQINGKTPTLENGKIQALAVFPGNHNVMYAGGGVGSGSEGPPSQAGAFRTTDGGAHWSAINNGLTDTSVNALWVDSTNQNLVLAGTEFGGISRSTDGGNTWTTIGNYAPVSDFLQIGGTLLAAAGPGILGSTDGGATWSPVVSSKAPVRTLATGGGVTLAGTDAGVVLWQAQAGAAFQPALQAPGPAPVWIWSLAVNPSAPNQAYAVIGHGNSPSALMATNDSGHNWTNVGVGAGPQAVAFAPSLKSIFVAGTDGLWVSTDGQNWKGLSFGRWDSRRIYWDDAQKLLYLGTDQGLHLSTDGGTSFSSMTATLANSITTGLAVKGSTILAGVHDFDPMVSFNGGSSWTQPSYKAGGLPGGEDGPAAISGSYCYLDTAAGYQYSTDGCQTFHMTGTPQLRGLTFVRPGGVNVIAVAPSDPTQVFLAAAAGVAKSTDSGVTMTPTSWPLSQTTAIAVHPRDPKTILVGSVNGLFRTADGGGTWTPVSTSGAGLVTTLAFDPADPSVVLAGMSQAPANGGAGVLRSRDGGATFQPSNTGLPATMRQTACCGWDILSIRFSTNGLAALGTRAGAYLSNDGGQTWQSITGNAVSTYFSDLAWDGGYLYAATYGSGVIRTPLAATTMTANPISLAFPAGGAAQSVAVTSNPAGAAFTASATTTSGGPWLEVTPKSGTAPGGVSVTVNATGLAAGTYNGTITITSATTVTPATVAVSLTVPPAASPVVVADVVNGASYGPAIAAGSWVTIRGAGLSQTERTWGPDDFVNGQPPLALDGVSATINGNAAVIYYISSTQLNVLAPTDAGSGAVPVVVMNGLGKSAPVNATVAAVAPAFFTIGPQAPAATHLDGSLIGPPDLYPGSTTPAQPGETIILYGTGFGAAPDQATVSVEIGGTATKVLFAGNVGPGLCQINAVVPAGARGPSALTASVGGVATPALTLAIQP
jgi:uncharacterized protein (TIGR03437 family)